MSDNAGINYKEYYEEAGRENNIWNWHGQKFEYYREMLRYNKLAKMIGSKRCEILDLGCGDGFLSCMLAQNGHKVDAIDISSERLSKFAERAKELDIKQICGSVTEYSFEKSYDVVVSSEVMEHLEDYESILKDVCTVLKTNGRLIIAVPYRERINKCKCPYCMKEFNMYGHLHSFNEEVFQKLAVKLGCNIAKIKTLNNKLTTYMSKFGPLKTYTLYKVFDRLFSILNKKMDTHMIVEMLKNE